MILLSTGNVVTEQMRTILLPCYMYVFWMIYAITSRVILLHNTTPFLYSFISFCILQYMYIGFVQKLKCLIRFPCIFFWKNIHTYLVYKRNLNVYRGTLTSFMYYLHGTFHDKIHCTCKSFRYMYVTAAL